MLVVLVVLVVLSLLLQKQYQQHYQFTGGITVMIMFLCLSS
jgi:hypothetical protein